MDDLGVIGSGWGLGLGTQSLWWRFWHRQEGAMATRKKVWGVCKAWFSSWQLNGFFQWIFPVYFCTVVFAQWWWKSGVSEVHRQVGATDFGLPYPGKCHIPLGHSTEACQMALMYFTPLLNFSQQADFAIICSCLQYTLQYCCSPPPIDSGQGEPAPMLIPR